MSALGPKAALLSEHTRQEIDAWVAKFPPGRQRSAVLSALRLAQEQNEGYLTPELLAAVAEYLTLPPMQVYEVASFYSMYELHPCGRHHVSICTNISCMLNGADELVAVAVGVDDRRDVDRDPAAREGRAPVGLERHRAQLARGARERADMGDERVRGHDGAKISLGPVVTEQRSIRVVDIDEPERVTAVDGDDERGVRQQIEQSRRTGRGRVGAHRFGPPPVVLVTGLPPSHRAVLLIRPVGMSAGAPRT